MLAVDQRVLKRGALLELHVRADDLLGDGGGAVETDRDVADAHAGRRGGRGGRAAGDGLRAEGCGGNDRGGDEKGYEEGEARDETRGGLTACSFQSG